VTDQGIKNLTNAEATALAVRNRVCYCPSDLFHWAVHFYRAQTLILALKIFSMLSKPRTTLPGRYIYKPWIRVLLKSINVSGSISAKPYRFLILRPATDNVLDLTKGIGMDSQWAHLANTIVDWPVEDVPPQEIGRLHLTQNPWVWFPLSQWNRANQTMQQKLLCWDRTVGFCPGAHGMPISLLKLLPETKHLFARWRASSLQKIPSFSLASSLTPVCSTPPADRSTVTSLFTWQMLNGIDSVLTTRQFRCAIQSPFRKFLKPTAVLIFRLTAPYRLSVCWFRCDSKYYFFAYHWAAVFLRPTANFQRDGRAVHDDNQGNRPNYPSTQEPLNLPTPAYKDANHTIWVRGLNLCITN